MIVARTAGSLCFQIDEAFLVLIDSVMGFLCPRLIRFDPHLHLLNHRLNLGVEQLPDIFEASHG